MKTAEIVAGMWKERTAASVLKPFAERCAYPKAESGAWTRLKEDKTDTVLAWAKEAAQGAYPMLSATDFMAFVRTGDRQAFEKPYFARRRKLIGAALGACVCGEPAMLDTVIDGLWCICEETFWGISAHNDYSFEHVNESRPLPNKNAPYIDLFAAQTGCTLALTLHLLGDRLDAVTPLLRRRVMDELETRIFTPFFAHDDFWWMGVVRHDLCNWTPWILSGILIAAQYTMADDARLGKLIERASVMLDRYLACVPEDGGCDEGAGYWNMAGGALLDCLEAIRQMTGGRAQAYDNEKIRNIGLFPLRSHIAGDWFLNFADCDAKPVLDGERLYVYGRRVGSEELARLGAAMGPAIVPRDTPQMNRVLDALLTDMPAEESAADSDVSLNDLQVWVRRRGELTFAVKGGHNGESHNHNDVGSFMVYHRGEPVVVDAGNLVYTAKTFSGERYTLWNTRSRNHNVPLIGETEQCSGTEHGARDVAAGDDRVRMEIASAYPESAGVRQLTRRFDFAAQGMTVTDDVVLDESQSVTWVLMTRLRPEWRGDRVKIGPVTASCGEAYDVSVEELPITDARMQRSFPGSLWRVALTDAPAREHHAAFVFTADEE